MSDSNPHRLIFTLFNEIGIIQQLSTARFSRVLAPDLNPSEFGVLNHFVRLGDGKTPTYLAKAFQMTKPSMTAILAKLERKGYVEVAASKEDRRQKIVTLTEAGRTARGKGLQAMALLADIILEFQDLSDLEAMLPKLQALREFLDQERNVVDGIN